MQTGAPWSATNRTEVLVWGAHGTAWTTLQFLQSCKVEANRRLRKVRWLAREGGGKPLAGQVKLRFHLVEPLGEAGTAGSIGTSGTVLVNRKHLQKESQGPTWCLGKESTDAAPQGLVG